MQTVKETAPMPVSGSFHDETLPIPADLRAREIVLTDNARTVLRKRYLRRGEDGKPVETEQEMFWRVAYNIALAESKLGGDQETVVRMARRFFDILTQLQFFPNSPTFTGAGTPLGQLAACFTADMRVTTADGLKRIADLQPGELVLTHQGRLRPVTQVYQRSYSDTLLRIKVAQIGTALEVTPEHPILTPNGWVKAGDLKVGDVVAAGMPQETWPVSIFDLTTLQFPVELEVQQTVDAVRAHRPSTYQNSGLRSRWIKRFVEITPELGRLCGYYVSEGTLGPDCEYIRFTFAKDEISYHKDVAALVEAIFDLSPKIQQSNHGQWVQIDVYSRVVASWFKQNFGFHSYGKRLPTWLQYADAQTQEQFLIGVLRGDGLFYERINKAANKPRLFRTLRLTLSNPSLISQIWQLCLRLGYSASIRPCDTTYVTANARDTATLSIPPVQAQELAAKTFDRKFTEINGKYSRSQVSWIGKQPFFKIQQIDAQPFSGMVYNCEVEEDHTYVVEGIAVHNCFVLPIEDDMGRTDAGIFQTLRNAALIQQTGGGNGFAFSRLRPKGAIVRSSNGQATGPVGFLRVYDQAFGEIAQGGSRRGANMAVLRVDHPDIREFITCKTDESKITNFNISVGITDKFMQAVEADGEYELINPQDGKVWERVRAREIFDLIVKQAHHNGEPGVLFLDAANRQNPTPHLGELESTNPCFIGSTRVATSEGLLTIQEMAEREAVFMVATDARVPYGGIGLPANRAHGVAFRAASPAWKTRENTPVMKLVTRHGFTVTATPNHKFLTPDRGYVTLESLKPGDKLLLQSGEGAWSTNYQLPNVEIVEEALATMGKGGRATAKTRRDFAEMYANVPTEWSHDLGMIIGWLIGDGWLSPESGSPLGMVFSSAKDDAQTVIHEAMAQWFGPGHLHRRGSVDQLTYGQIPYLFFSALGVKQAPAHEKRVPEAIWSAPREAVIGFLQGLFTANGTVAIPKNVEGRCSVRLASSSKTLLEDVQLLLLNLGIVGRIYLRRQPGYRVMPDGKGGRKEYLAHADYELIIDKANRDRFVREVGFLDSKKQSKAEGFIAAKKRTANRELFVTKVESVEDAGTADVFDLTEPQTHSIITNGVVVHQCGEQYLLGYENCCLGSINVARIATPDGKVDWALYQELVENCTRFLDDVVTANKYVPAVPQLEAAAHNVRRIGLGIMGLGDLMYKLGVRYGSEEGQEFAGQITEFLRYHAMKTSIGLAIERGPFPAIKGSIYDPEALKWQPPMPLFPQTRDWGRPALDWDSIVTGIKQHGIRNGAQTTCAPTGTIATVSGCEAYGCEPAFALAYIRHVNDNGRDLQLQYTSPLFEAALKRAGLNDAQIKAIVEQVNVEGSCQNVPGVPDSVRHTFVVSADISVEEHIRMQAAMQAFVDNAISKTVNAPETATEEDVATAYKLGWTLGCKGMTVYVTGSRDKVVLETKATAQAKQTPQAEQPAATPEPIPAVPSAPAQFVKKTRPHELFGRTFRVETPLGKTYVTINENGEGLGYPFEIFTHTSKAGSETAAVSEAIGRLISLMLRFNSPISPRKRLEEIARELDGIGGGRSTGFGAARVRSLPDGIARILQEYLDETEGHVGSPIHPLNQRDEAPSLPHNNGGSQLKAALPASTSAPQASRAIGDLCPECGEPTLINEEGCRKCHSCGYSEC